VVHKFRISHSGSTPRKRSPRSISAGFSPPKSPFLRHPSPSQDQQLAHALIAATRTGSAGHRMSVFGSFIQEVPARIGHNPALDAAVTVLVNVHTSLVYKKAANEIVSPELYIRAIKTLQSCLEHPQLGLSPETLCASVLLGLVEVGLLAQILSTQPYLQPPGICRSKDRESILDPRGRRWSIDGTARSRKIP
jgi:hypothetical protein